MEASDSFFFMSNRFNLIWFKTKKEAYLYIEDLKKKNLFNGQVVIAYEYLSVGSRRFIVILYEELLSFYSKLRPNDRSFYEVLSTDLFCKLSESYKNWHQHHCSLLKLQIANDDAK